jgi:hypothetical protein
MAFDRASPEFLTRAKYFRSIVFVSFFTDNEISAQADRGPGMNLQGQKAGIKIGRKR